MIGDTANVAIGQGDVLASPLQLAVMTARLATGKMIKPKLIADSGKTESEEESVTPDAKHLKAVRKAMYNVSNSRTGTAYRSRVIADAFRMAGKTGTSQVFTITEAERKKGITSNEDREWERRDHALFVCFAPFDDPKIAVSVVVEHGGSGSTTAAPMARDILLQALYKGEPPITAYPVKDREDISQQQKLFNDLLPNLASEENVET